jgi:hypothetical protein
MQGERLLRGSGVAQQVSVAEGWKPYRRFGQQDWDPAAVGPMNAPEPGTGFAAERARAARRAMAEARRAEFAEHRAGGLGVAEAGAAVGVTAATAKAYERLRKAGAA